MQLIDTDCHQISLADPIPCETTYNRKIWRKPSNAANQENAIKRISKAQLFSTAAQLWVNFNINSYFTWATDFCCWLAITSK